MNAKEAKQRTNPFGRNKESWRQEQCTPPLVFRAAQRLAAKRWPHLECWDTCARDVQSSVAGECFWGPHHDGLSGPWYTVWGACEIECRRWFWCNPPFRHAAQWVAHATAQVMGGASVIMLLPAGDLQARWVRQHHHAWDVFMLAPRVNYLHPDTRVVQQGAPSPSMLWVSRPEPGLQSWVSFQWLFWKEDR